MIWPCICNFEVVTTNRYGLMTQSASMAAIRPMQTSQKREGLPDVVLPLRKVEDRRKRTDCCRSSSPRSGRASPRPLENNRLEL